MGNQSSGSNDVNQSEVFAGYRILGSLPNSPSSEIGVISYFDYIIAAGGIPLEDLDNTLLDILVSNVGREIDLTIYNSKIQDYREVSITPSMDWPGQGLLGMKICWAEIPSAGLPVFRVLEVFQGSPADAAGLIPGRDFLLGTADYVFENQAELYHTIKANLEKVLKVYVYNMDADFVRIAYVLPSFEWGGGGCFGARVAFGYVHDLPEECRETIGRCTDHISVGDTSISVGQRAAEPDLKSEEHSRLTHQEPPPIDVLEDSYSVSSSEEEDKAADLYSVTSSEEEDARGRSPSYEIDEDNTKGLLNWAKKECMPLPGTVLNGTKKDGVFLTRDTAMLRRRSSGTGMCSPENAEGYVCRFADCDHFFSRFEPWCQHMKKVHNLRVTTEEGKLQQMHTNMGLQKGGRYVCPFGGCVAGVIYSDCETEGTEETDHSLGIVLPPNAEEGFDNLQELELHLKQKHGLRVARGSAEKGEVEQAEKLCHAVKYGKQDEVRELLAQGTDPRWANEAGDTALHIACMFGKYDLAQVLLKAGALVDQLDSPLGQTPLHCACYYGRTKLIELMLQSGADPSITNQEGEKPGESFDDRVDEHRKKEVLQILATPTEEAEVNQQRDIKSDEEKALEVLVIKNAAEELKLFEAKRENQMLTQRLEKLLGDLATVKLQLGPLFDVAKQVEQLEAEIHKYSKEEQESKSPEIE